MSLFLQKVSKVYGRRTVVKEVTLSVQSGEIVGLLGPNGAGKTTTFYLAAGLEQPNTGRVWFQSQDVTRLPLHRRARLGISYLTQETSIFRHLSVQDNLLLVMEQSGVPAHLRSQHLYSLLSDFQLHTVADLLGVQISGGERRRTEIARALAVGSLGPRFLLLDEPFAGIDPMAVADIQRILTQLRDRNLGILITDHNVRETLAITNRAYILREGEMLASGSPEALYQNNLVQEYYLGSRFQR